MSRLTILVAVIVAISSLEAAILVNQVTPQVLTVKLENGSLHQIDLSEDYEDYGKDILECPEKTASNIKLKLFTQSSPLGFLLTNSSAAQAALNPDEITTVISHGWLDSGRSPWMIQMKNRYLNQTTNQVILVDWGRYSKDPYNVAAKKTREIGTCVADILVALLDAGKTNVNKVHIIGHSLGAHIAGFAGKEVIQRSKEKVLRITALDAAGPLFAFPVWKSESKRLCSDDAQFVDAIHTCGGVLGIKRAFAHADFFPNGGTGIQPGCGAVKNDICSHLRSHTYYYESIETDQFVGKQCDSYKHYEKGKCDKYRAEPMGLPTPFGLRGTFYLDTNDKAPYALG